MRTLILTALFSLFSSQTIFAKDYLLFTLQGGVSAFKVSDSKNIKFKTSAGTGPSVNLALMLNLKHIQAGAGWEHGNMMLPYTEYYWVDAGKGYVEAVRDKLEKRDIATTSAFVYGVLNYKIHLPRSAYAYVGGVLGKFTGRNEFVHSRYSTGTMTGINAGISLRLSKRWDVTINESWRIASIQPDNQRAWDRITYNSMGSRYQKESPAEYQQYEPMELQSLNTTIGIVLKLF